jgi:hypothetical protein
VEYYVNSHIIADKAPSPSELYQVTRQIEIAEQYYSGTIQGIMMFQEDRRKR